MQQMGDDASVESSKGLQKKLWARERLSSFIGYAVPTIHAQQQLTGLSGAGLRNYLLFLESTRVFHERLRLEFYPKIFEEKPAGTIDWSKHSVSFFTERVDVNWLQLVLPYGLLLVLLAGWIVPRLKRVEGEPL
jgi:ABC-2 type transport system permease protein